MVGGEPYLIEFVYLLVVSYEFILTLDDLDELLIDCQDT